MTQALLGKALMLIGAALVLALIFIGVTAEITRVRHEVHAPVGNSQTFHGPDRADRAELQRCQSLGEAATTDAACLAHWAETRRQFLTPASPPGAGD